ncbi:hypothetical protein FJY70_01580, partial [candidate division WOR-3 bacterium]|nr:hypothetical protein [candidate division WOR-3 bacterium]
MDSQVAGALKNQELARKFGLIADALELKGETGFRVLAYRKAARALSDLGADIETLDAEGRLEEVPGIGAGIAKKIHEYLSTGRMAKYEEAVGALPSGLFELLEVQGLGPKTAKLLYEKLGVTNPTDLKQAIEHGRVTELPGMGDKKVANLRRGLEAAQKAQERMLLDEAFALAAAALERLQGCRFVRKSAYGGSLRRGCETVGDIDLLVTGSRPKEIVKRFTSHPGVRQVLGAGETKASVLMESSKGNEPPVGANSPVGEVSQPRQMQNRGPESSPPVPSPVGADSHPRCGLRQVDLRVVAGPEYGAALQYFTGSKDHNVALRALAQKQGLKLSEYGLFRGERQVAGRTEEEVYSALGLAYIEPELRENRGELEAAQADRLPRLVTQGQIKSDLHVHTSASDGAAGLEEMAESCRRRGYTHLAIADHSVSAGYAGGQGEDALLRHCDRVDRFN